MLNVECWMFILMLNVECWMLTWWGVETRNSFYSFYSCLKTPNPGRLHAIRTSWLQNYEINPKWLGQNIMLNVECWMIWRMLNDLENVECWMLSVEWFRECWMLSVECWFLPNGLNGASLIQHSTLNTQHST